MTTSSYTFKPDDIVYTHNASPTFYRVTKRTRCIVTLQPIQSEVIAHDDGDYGQSGWEVPVNIAETGPAFGQPVRTKIKINSDGNEEARIDGKWYQRVRPYNGKPVMFDTYR